MNQRLKNTLNSRRLPEFLQRAGCRFFFRPGRSLLFLSVLLWSGNLVASSATPPKKSKGVDFNFEIRPLISSQCFHCHGPDETSRKAKLRLDIREDALRVRKNGAAIVPGAPEKSLLYQRITSKDPDEVMPPPESGHALTPKEIELFRRWIQQGAPYAVHWSFVKPERPEIPRVKQKRWPQSGLDYFVLAAMEKQGLKPSSPADRFALIRRVSLDLTGLPPTPAEIQAFLQDKSPQAYEKLVDRLLQSPHFGERWARMWLDLARYADSAGYGSDPLRMNIWPYRDWVIEAFNRNLLYDQFTLQQLAGDLLPGATEEQQVATAFHRNTMTNTEGGTDDEEFRVAAVKDRANTTAQVWMGLTMGCAQCHTHKYDPITQTEYYQFYALFNQTEDFDQPDERPTLSRFTPAQQEQRAQIQSKIEAAEKDLHTSLPALEASQAAWEASNPLQISWAPLETRLLQTEHGTQLQTTSDGSVLATGPNPPKEVYTFETTLPPEATALRLEVLADDSLPNKGPGRSGNNFVLNEIRVTQKVEGKSVSIPLRHGTADFSQNDWTVDKAIDGDAGAGSGWAVAPQFGVNHTAYFEIGGPIAAAPVKVELIQNYGGQHTIGKFKLSVTRQLPPVRLHSPAITKILEKPKSNRSEAEARELADFYRSQLQTQSPALKKIQELKNQLAAIKPVPLPIMKEVALEKRRQTRIMQKGNFLTPGDAVQPAFPASFAPRSSLETNRLGVAQWLMSPENPLTARVAVNRFWAQIFGVGLVETEEDFGSQGALPSHPELLDWLAVEFRENGWDMKQFIKSLVLSSTYQQTSAVTPQLLEKDPRNRWLTRSPRRRLEAETVRDQALALSGLLSKKIGGPSVYPPQPPGLWQAAFNGERTWPTSTGEDKHRRGIYTFWRRTVPYPSMATFDAPSREICTVRRLPTNTPLQAFVTLNDPVYVEAAQALGRRIYREGGASLKTRLEYGITLCQGRPATASQVTALEELFEKERHHYAAQEEAAKKLATEPIGPLEAGMNPAEMAAWTVVGNVLLNLDAVLTKN